MSTNSSIDFILKSLSNNLEDLDILFKNDDLIIDLEFYAATQLALLRAERSIKNAQESFRFRRKKFKELPNELT